MERDKAPNKGFLLEGIDDDAVALNWPPQYGFHKTIDKFTPCLIDEENAMQAATR